MAWVRRDGIRHPGEDQVDERAPVRVRPDRRCRRPRVPAAFAGRSGEPASLREPSTHGAQGGNHRGTIAVGLAKLGDDLGGRFSCGKASFRFATQHRPRIGTWMMPLGAGRLYAPEVPSSASCRRIVSTPDAAQTAESRSANSRPDRRFKNASPRCASHSQTEMPCVRCSCFRCSRPPRPQIAHGGHTGPALSDARSAADPSAPGTGPASRPERFMPPRPTVQVRKRVRNDRPPGSCAGSCPNQLSRRYTDLCQLRHNTHSWDVTIGRRAQGQMAVARRGRSWAVECLGRRVSGLVGWRLGRRLFGGLGARRCR